MSRLAKVLLAIVGVVVAIGLIAVLVFIYTVRRPFPKTDGTVTVAGLREEVTVFRDEFGIPHIFAQNLDDLFFAQGYVHAQDRFWQMEFWRHIGQGRISEIAGEGSLELDKFIRTMGWNRIGADTLSYYEQESPGSMAILDAYSAGVNAYIDEHRDELSVNYAILGLVNEPWEIEPWTPLNTITWAVVMSDNLSSDWGSELRRANLIKDLGEEMVDSIWLLYPYDRRPVIVSTEALEEFRALEVGRSETVGTVDWSRVNTDIVGEIPGNGFALGDESFVGSNNWVVSGEHTDTGLPLLANDPHLGIQMPAIWYEIGLHSPDLNVVGFSFAGTPGVVIGHNENIAWGVTNVGADVQDLYIERINPDNPRQYEFEGEWRDMEVVEEVIKVNGGQDVILEVLATQHGPIINEIVDGESDVLALRWTAQEPSRILESLFMLNQAKNYEEFREALRYWDVPSQNFVYADKEGNIGYQAPGLMPLRKNGDGRSPVPGWTGDYEWEGWVPFEEMPALFNPESGYIVTANHAVVDQEYPFLIALNWADGNRAQRITDLLEESLAVGMVTADDFARIQFDSKSLLAQDYVPLLVKLSTSDSQVQEAIELLGRWDLQARRDSVPAGLFELFFNQMVPNVLADDVGEDNVWSIANVIFFHEIVGDPDASWWDNGDTPEVETREDILLLSLEEALAWFDENLGGSLDDWNWGSIHTATFVSAPLGQSGIGLIESIVNRGPYPADGGFSIVNANSWNQESPAAITGHPSMRMIVDLNDLDASQTVLPTGQSGHPYHRHYDDMVELWLNGQYHPMLFSRAVIEDAAKDQLVLQPAD